MDFMKIVIRRNVAKCNKARLRAQPDLKNLLKGDWGKSPQRAKLYKSALLANLRIWKNNSEYEIGLRDYIAPEVFFAILDGVF